MPLRGRLIVGTAVVVVLAVVAAVPVLRYRETYWSWPWQQQVGQITSCERQFLPLDVPPMSGAVAFPRGTRTELASLPYGRGTVYSARTEAERAARRGAGSFCDTTVYLRVGDDRYLRYGGTGGD